MTNTIFATGVFLEPVKIKLNECEQWRWVVVGFEDDNFHDGNEIGVREFADSYEKLFIND